MPKVCVPGPYQGPTKGLKEILVEGRTIRECLDAVEAAYPGFAPYIYDGGPDQLQGFTKIFHNGDPVPAEGLDAAVAASDEIQVMTAIAGG